MSQSKRWRATHQPDAPPLEFHHVYQSYATSAYTLEDVTFELQEGEQIAVVGPNGAGKSTLFKLIAGVLTPTRGHILMYGHQPDKHICIAYVPQRSQIDWGFPVTVEDVVMMGRVGQIGLFKWPARQDRFIVKKALKRVQAEALAEKQISELSGGQQQRVFIARALAQQAELILLDEPFNGLDVPSQEAISAILDGLRDDGITVLIATHDLQQAEARFDRVMLLNKRVIAFGAPARVLTANNLKEAYGGGIRPMDESLLITMSGDHTRDEVATS